MYQRVNPAFSGMQESCVKRLADGMFIPFALANTDYQAFKSEINADEAQLQDADGNVMSAADAKAFVATLP